MNPVHPGKNQRFIFQWHINEICNLKCLHCYQENATAGNISVQEMQKIFSQIQKFIPEYKIHINITGGEPFLHPEMEYMLKTLENLSSVSYGILSNGTLIDRSFAKTLKKYNVSFVQVSLDGVHKKHDHIRGEGSFGRAVSGIKNLGKENIPVQISFTANTLNYKYFSEVASLGRKLGVQKVWTDRVIPCGSAADSDMSLNPEKTKEFMEILTRESEKNGRTKIDSHRALQFLLGTGNVYKCAAAKNLLTIMPGGDVLPCRRLPIRIGNVYENTLMEILHNSEFSRKMVSGKPVSGCETCFYEKTCNGGLKCLAYAVKGDAWKSDPGCWLASDNKYFTKGLS